MSLFFYALVIMMMCFAVFFLTRWIWDYRYGRAAGPDSAGKNPTMFDVRQLIIAGEKRQAIKVYQRIFRTTEKDAAGAVDELAQHIHKD